MKAYIILPFQCPEAEKRSFAEIQQEAWKENKKKAKKGGEKCSEA